MRVVELPARPESAVAYARALLGRCERGEVLEVTAVEVAADGSYCVQGSAVADRTRAAGQLLDAAVTRLQNDD